MRSAGPSLAALNFPHRFILPVVESFRSIAWTPVGKDPGDPCPPPAASDPLNQPALLTRTRTRARSPKKSGALDPRGSTGPRRRSAPYSGPPRAIRVSRSRTCPAVPAASRLPSARGRLRRISRRSSSTRITGEVGHCAGTVATGFWGARSGAPGGRRASRSSPPASPDDEPQWGYFRRSRPRLSPIISQARAGTSERTWSPHSTVTLFARFRGWSMSRPRLAATW